MLGLHTHTHTYESDDMYFNDVSNIKKFPVITTADT